MNSPWRELAQWIRRARPPAPTVLVALLTGSCAAATGVALFIGAPYLLAYSDSHSSLVAGGTLALLLIVIELLAFLRSPLRFVERMSAHDLGLRSVTQWRRWLVVNVGSWPYSRWRAASSGDLLERAIGDTDALQDLWLRCLIPLSTLLIASLGADIFVATLHTSSFSSGFEALTLALSQLAAVGVVAALFPRLVRSERLVRHARATRSALRLELQAVAPEIELLGQGTFLSERLIAHNKHVAALEQRRVRRWSLAKVVGVAAPLSTLGLVVLVAHGVHHVVGRSGLVIVLVALGVVELTLVALSALRVAVTVTSSAERLEQLLAKRLAAHIRGPTTP